MVQFKVVALLLGQDNENIYSSVLGLNEEQIQELEGKKVI
jgi:crotonobetainyl-CoA:carnitine CoA-transferase CaiB-like acyl-CoA transferase